MITIAYKPVDSMAALVALGLLALLAGSAVLGLCVIVYKVVQLLTGVTQ